jgi:putative sterol carrier protein
MTTSAMFGTLGFYQLVAENLNADPKWRDKSSRMNFTIIFSYGPPVDTAFALTFDNGAIGNVHVAEPAEMDDAQFVISAPAEVFRSMIEGKLKPTMAIATGKFKVKGDLKVLLKEMTAFQYFLDSMSKIPLGE